jgi:hypothetical protein
MLASLDDQPFYSGYSIANALEVSQSIVFSQLLESPGVTSMIYIESCANHLTVHCAFEGQLSGTQSTEDIRASAQTLLSLASMAPYFSGYPIEMLWKIAKACVDKVRRIR